MGYLGGTLGGLVAVSVAVIAGCAGEVVPTFGPPEGLAGKPQPNPGSGGGGPPASDAGVSGDSSTSVECDASAVACSVSWKNDLYPKMASTGIWQCASSLCHSGGLNVPVMPDNDATGTYNALVQFAETDLTGRPVILPCSTDPTKSTFECLISIQFCGTAEMPETTSGAQSVSTADFGSIDTWIKCGAPLN